MHEGIVHAGGDAVVKLQIRGPGGAVALLPTIVDTGFTQSLVVPSRLARALNLEMREIATYTLADGSTIDSSVFAAEVFWFNTWVPITVGCMEGGSLLGMHLLAGCRMSIDVIEGGRVAIERLG